MDSVSSPTVSNETIVETYGRVATLYDWFVAPFEAGTRDRALDLLSVESEDTVLELGCGPGHALVSLARRVGRSGHAIGLDAAPGMVARAHRRASRSDTREQIDLVLGDARSLPFDAGTVDAIFVEDTLELFSPTEVRSVLAECERVLTADGRIGVVTMERAGGERDPFVRAYEWVYRHVPGYQRVGCRPIYARRALETEGFEIERQERHRRGYVWPADILIARAPSR